MSQLHLLSRGADPGQPAGGILCCTSSGSPAKGAWSREQPHAAPGRALSPAALRGAGTTAPGRQRAARPLNRASGVPPAGGLQLPACTAQQAASCPHHSSRRAAAPARLAGMGGAGLRRGSQLPPSTWCAARHAGGRGGARGLRRFFAAVRPGAAAVFRPGDRLLCRYLAGRGGGSRRTGLGREGSSPAAARPPLDGPRGGSGVSSSCCCCRRRVALGRGAAGCAAGGGGSGRRGGRPRWTMTSR